MHDRLTAAQADEATHIVQEVISPCVPVARNVFANFAIPWPYGNGQPTPNVSNLTWF